jgi:signal transduction histidine kinase
MKPRHRLFAYLLLMRSPLAGEMDDIDAAYGWMRRNALWLALAYAVTLGFAVWPAFADSYDPPYRSVAVVGTHFLLWLLASTIATCWVGFRIGYWASSVGGAIQAIVGVTLVFALYFLFYADPRWQDAFQRWLSDTFGSLWVLLGAIFLVVYGVPDLVARLRRRERAAVTRALKAEASSERLARQTAESELRLLQAQVEPHFLYNTLANLRYLIQKNSPDALRMTDALIEYLRTSVPDMRAARVTLGREADHARHYLEIMQMRMGNRLAFAVDVPAALRDVEVPPLVLLTLVENAIKHGIAPLVEGGTVTLRAREDGQAIAIEVADTGVGPPAAGAHPAATDSTAKSTGVGLDNLRGRLQLAYGTDVAVELAPHEPRGTRVRLRLPRTMPRSADAAADRPTAQVRVPTVDPARSAGLLGEDGS